MKLLVRPHSLMWLAALVLALPGSTRAGDMEDLLQDLVGPLTRAIGTHLDCNAANLCGGDAANKGLLGTASFELAPLAEFTASVVNDRIVPLSSSVTGFTYEYNETLDVYERSTSTFGPLFTERAQTLGRRRFLAGISHSYLEFDEFEGDGLDNTTVSTLGGFTDLGTSQAGGLAVLTFTNTQAAFDIALDLEIKQSISTVYMTYGVTDRIDVGVVLPLIHIDIDATAFPTTADGGELPTCDSLIGEAFDTRTCLALASSAVKRSDSDSHFGIGDLVLRGKWHFLSGPAEAAFVMSASLPTGDDKNLTGFGDPTFTPGFVFSKDFETPLGGLGTNAFVGYEFRTDESDRSEFEWSVGASIQPMRRVSMNLDFLGTEERDPDNSGGSTFDLSAGLKLMLARGLLFDVNYIAPLNDDGLRASGGILSAQIEWVFGD